MSWLFASLIGWLLVKLGSRFIGWLRAPRASDVAYLLEPAENWALALAHPMAHAQMEGGFADCALPTVAPELAQQLRPQLLHLFGVPTNLTDERIRSTLPARLDQHWFRIDLDALRPDDDPRAAMAFACARVAFAVRTAAMLGWIGSDQQWRILHQNADRAGQCFSGWLDYGTAWARGRRQWIARARADSLGTHFSEDDVKQWLSKPRHPWRLASWPNAPA